MIYPNGRPERYVHDDHLGTPRKITDAAKTVVWANDYRPFGQVGATTAAVENNLRFLGQHLDGETGLHYTWHRYYDPDIGRYLTPGLIGLAGGINLYAYANSNPINLTDPQGLFAWGIPAYGVIKWGGAKLGSFPFRVGRYDKVVGGRFPEN
ncbi:MAG: RHS domain-containing protein [Desulfobacterium sp.]|nr:RHS domain-containing protein [Desulfobacterium sp.]